jgi:hypothetical protein
VDGDAQLDAIKERVRALAGLADATAAEAAPLVQAAARRTAAAGTTPDGRAWVAKKDGGRPLAGAANAIAASAAGPTIAITLEGVEVYHHHGVGKTTPERQIIPKPGDPIPVGIAEAIGKGAVLAFSKLAGQ